MKKLLKVLAVAIFALTPFIIGSSASAASTCDIGFTGPDSQNQCTSVTKYSCSVTNTNEVKIKDKNDQVVASGVVSNNDNTQGGNSTSGSVTNTNGTTFSVVITNSNPESETSGTCVATVVVPAVVTPVVQPTQPETGGSGGAGGAATLPETSGDFTPILIIVASSMAVIAGLGVGGVALYRYFKSL